MADKSHLSLMRACFQDRFLFLLVSLLCLILLTPLLESFVRLKILIDIFVTIVFISGIYTVSNKKSIAVVSSILAIPMLISLWGPVFTKTDFFILIGDISGIVFMILMVFSILSYIFNEQEASANVIYASIVVYLLLALMWSFIYSVVEILNPGSFSIPEQTIEEGRSVFAYYSMVTITTLGYGDITPVTNQARAFSMLEAVVGQIYLVVLVARLVGINIAQTMNKKE